MFNIVQFDIEGRSVLDLFAGTGQLGIEALSRGADRCVFVDQNRAAAAVVRENLDHTRLTDRARVVQAESLGFLTSCREKFDLIFLDPPYHSDLLEQAVKTAAEIDILKEHGIILCESGLEKELPQVCSPYLKGREYRYGKIKLTLYRRTAE